MKLFNIELRKLKMPCLWHKWSKWRFYDYNDLERRCVRCKKLQLKHYYGGDI